MSSTSCDNMYAEERIASKYSDELSSPCRWCGYTGRHYSQHGSHHEGCPWHQVAGDKARAHLLRLHDSGITPAAAASALERLHRYERDPTYRKKA